MDLSLFNQSNLLYTEESLLRYQPGGYHPVSLGDTFKNGRYGVRHKLGWGGFSTVWLAKDRVRNQWVSLKIMTADSGVSREWQNLKDLERHSRGNLSSNYIVQLLDSFTHEGPNGVHQCFVFELLGPSVDHVLADYHENHDKLCAETIIRMSTQLLKAVEFIHGTGMCHGDISGRNIAFNCTNLLNTTEEQLFEFLGFPEIEALARLDGTPLENGLPKQLVKAAEWVEWIDEDDEDIRLLDFGESFLQGEGPKRLAQPGTLRVPETIFTNFFDYRADLWRTGCMIYSFLFTTYPFWYLGEDEVLVFQMISFVERLPTEWESKWKSMQTRSSHDLEVEDCAMSKLERKFAETVRDAKLKPLLRVTQGLMRFLPSRRITADEALNLL
ncbi:kinase-like domain-containing protein [Lipomyces kononenkoae]|uniref:Kinase-like domain-containing protein n=1 Tax=Lipomyces kononenkoae TaxID=34357 RepID=A0ACC3SYF0_LIPKO